MLIIEGPDCVGKTYFANECVRLLNSVPMAGTRRWRYQHFTSPPPDWDSVEDYRDVSGVFSVMDRHALSELVYHAAYDRPTFMTANMWSDLEYMMQDLGTVTVVVTADNDVTLRTCMKHKAAGQKTFAFAEEEPDFELVSEVNGLFQWLHNGDAKLETRWPNEIAKIKSIAARPQIDFNIMVSLDERGVITWPSINKRVQDVVHVARARATCSRSGNQRVTQSRRRTT